MNCNVKDEASFAVLVWFAQLAVQNDQWTAVCAVQEVV